MTEREAMQHALRLALRGWGRVAPNPMVGAVLLRDGQVVGEGYHAEFGGPHAEIAAMEACDDPAGTTCVVTLEPCHHHGKTPPCTTALREAGVTRVVAAVPDPNPDAAGGLSALAEAGIDVELGLEREAAAALNAPFLWSVRRPERPFVALKLATTADGYIADHERHSRWISGPEGGRFVQWLRAGFDAIGVGRHTATEDDPLLTVRGELQPRTPPHTVVFAGSGSVSPDLRLFQSVNESATAIVATPTQAEALSEVFAGYDVTVLPAEDDAAGMRALADWGVRSILVEGGGVLARRLLDGGVVDRLYWVVAPIFLGRGVPAFPPGAGVRLDDAEGWVTTERRAVGRDTLLVMDRALCLLD